MDQGAACDRGHVVDGRHALFAAAVRLSLRSSSWIEAIRDVQGDGAAAAEGDHQSGHDRNLVGRALPGLGWSLVFGTLVARQSVAGGTAIGCPRLFFPLRQGFRRRSQRPQSKILSYYQRGTNFIDGRDRDSGGGQAVLTGNIFDSSTSTLLAESQLVFYIA